MTGRVLVYQRTPLVCDTCGTGIDPDEWPCHPHEPDCTRPRDGCGCDLVTHPEHCFDPECEMHP